MNPIDQEPLDLSQLRDITGIEQLPPAAPENSPLIWPWISLVFLAAFAIIVWKLARRRRPEKPSLAPDAWALAELEYIDKMDHLQSGEGVEYHRLIADVIRSYVELRFQVPATQQTTPEFLRTISSAQLLAVPEQLLLGSFLERCDLAKFARAGYSPAECRISAQMARDLVLQTTPANSKSGKTRAKAAMNSEISANP